MWPFNHLLFTSWAALGFASCGLSSPLAFDSREATIESVHRELFSRKTTCREVVSSFLARIEEHNPKINAVVSLNPHALEYADDLDKILQKKNPTGSLFCIPILLKDNYNTVDMKTTGSSTALKDSQPTVDAPSVKAFRDAGAILLGKVNLHEFALEGLSVSSLGGQTLNPYDLTRTPGGSSGGTGAAIAASFAVLGTGTDTVNSLRSPASANSLFSIRPTRGLISRAGVIPVSYTQDALGPIARTLKDAATALTVMANVGYDPKDNVTALVPDSVVGVDYTPALAPGSLRGIRLGLIEGFFNRTEDFETSSVNKVMDDMVSKLRAAGATVLTLDEKIYNSTMISNNLDVQRFEFRELMDAYLQDETLGGSHPSTLAELYSSRDYLVIPSQHSYVNTALISSTSNATYATRQYGIQHLKLALQTTFKSHSLDAIIYPEQQNLVVKTGSASQHGRNGILGALTGSPVVTIPAGFSPPSNDAPDGVPIGLEILGLPWMEQKLLNIASKIGNLGPVRRIPRVVSKRVGSKKYVTVPRINPNSGGISGIYPVGVLGI
ncbi:hypothetical protein AJ78_06287 [Emergomyces pasteurianus Ep9510]|uniref:Amidase domain-containing protein n=1 Tax=Emergomyces pasteurianus Ep9510 TaxID=1447872 RepID=A0A1J9P9R2_9EURO|nr:hypothetical protein AJ78_06287 [Emergomyces pasteurianus Ep9510]